MSQDEHHLENIVAGTLMGALCGGELGLGACIFIFAHLPLFTGDTILIGAILVGAFGYFLGEEFINWMQENWWWFW